jgi:ABC-type multidrug transport system fused ATPase/permease subunit
MAHADEFIINRHDSYEAIIGDRGMKLSGGQKQRLALARTLLTRPEILILDEATSALDTKSEKFIQKAIESLKGGMTIIIIAHRLSTIEKADIIFRIDRGRVIESGTFKKIIQKNR